MTAVNELLDNVKIRLNLASDMALAERLTVTRSLVSRWRKGDTPLADERIAQICALAKLDGPTWIAMIHAERATSATERALWRLMLDRMSAAAAVVALVALSMPGLANAKTAQIQAVSGDESGSMYIMLPRGLPSRTQPVQSWPHAAPLQVPPNAARTWLHGANFSPSMQARRCRLDAPLKDGFGDAPG
ncbi:TPA: DUF3693 domain-containing protein [Stenotrophomonas maltophilia]|nr:DUF3693 domain-containing protein [Stenotrophomonas maltophilia]HDS1308263.1 hypothetical protein [Stenotrophomonas maltophilia]HDS1317575.1 hypothetical protein [Stenotrophomonas maltophilia]HDS1442230.1 hypothetical protein [Stenotrophomonas maltophilia]HDS1537246.1 hypothetical protein [Stenotrophomonas maltophilia]